MIFPIALKCHLRPNPDLREKVEGILSPAETELLCSAAPGDHAVLMTLQVRDQGVARAPHSVYQLRETTRPSGPQVMSELIDTAKISEFQKLQMHANITVFHDMLGGCERLLRTPIPLSYTRHTSRFLLIWLLVLPVCLWGEIGWGIVPSTPLIAMLLLGIEAVSYTHLTLPTKRIV